MTEPAGGPAPDGGPALDPVPVVLGALGFAAVLGLGLQAAVTWGVRALQTGQPAEAPSLTSGPALLLLIGTLGGMVAAGIAAWGLLLPLRNPWRQAMLAIIAGAGSFVLSLVTIPVDRLLGRAGLAGLAVLSGAACFAIARRISRRRAAALGAAP